jgi:hypothetical protein
MTPRAGAGPIGMLAVVLLHGTACSKGADQRPAGGSGGSQPPAAASASPAAGAKPNSGAPGDPEPPATVTDVNLVAADAGGAVEELTRFYGPGLRVFIRPPSKQRLFETRTMARWSSDSEPETA